MRINTARHNESALGVDHFVARKPGADGGNAFPLNEDIGLIRPVSGNNRPAFDHYGHEASPRKRNQATSSAFSNTACINTLVPILAHASEISSASLWLMPSTQGVKIIEVGATRAR